MSLYIRLRINSELICAVEIIREHDDTSTDVDSVHTYQWRYPCTSKDPAVGTVEHRYGDGAIALAHKVLGEIALRHQIAAEMVDADA